MRSLTPITIAAGSAATIQLDNTVAGLILVNESALSVAVQVGALSAWLPAWTADFYNLSKLPSVPDATLTPQNLTSTSNPPSSLVLATLVAKGDIITGTYPYALTRQVSSNVTASSAFDLLAADSANMIYLDDTSVPGSIAIVPSQSPVPTGPLDVILSARDGSSSAQKAVYTDVANLHVQAGMKWGYELSQGTGLWIAGMEIVSGTGPGTPSHKLGVTPQIINISSSNGANAVGTSTWTSTGFTVSCAAGVDWYALLIV